MFTKKSFCVTTLLFHNFYYGRLGFVANTGTEL